jgi:hypothetical protein
VVTGDLLMTKPIIAVIECNIAELVGGGVNEKTGIL